MKETLCRLLAAVAVAASLIGGIGTPAGAVPSVQVRLAKVTPTWNWSSPSPDPQGVVWAPRLHRLLIVDSEVEETRLWAGANLFQARRNGALTSTASLLSFTAEPNDIVRDPKTGHYFVVSDRPRRLYEIAKGPDRRFFTDDDIVTSANLLMGAFADAKIRDAEGVAIGAGSLWIASDQNKAVYRIRPGADGRWTGSFAADDKISQWSTRPVGQLNPEGIEFDVRSGHLLLVSNDVTSDISEVTKGGRLVRVYDLLAIGSDSPSGLRFAPASGGNGRSLYMTDRGIDNASQPNENDGRFFELRLPSPNPTTDLNRSRVEPDRPGYP